MAAPGEAKLVLASWVRAVDDAIAGLRAGTPHVLTREELADWTGDVWAEDAETGVVTAIDRSAVTAYRRQPQTLVDGQAERGAEEGDAVDGMKREKVIEALEACVLKDPDDSRDCRHCPRCNYGAFITNSCINGVMADCLYLLKAQEPRLLTAEDFADNPDADSGGAIPCWKEARSATRRSGWAVIVYGRWLNDTEGGTSRYWTARPSEEQRKVTPW